MSVGASVGVSVGASVPAGVTGMYIFWPTKMLFGFLICGFAASSCAGVKPNEAAIVLKWSPGLTM